MNPDGSGLTQLTNDPKADRDPAWSADGRFIAFTRDGILYVMEHTGANQFRSGPISSARSPTPSQLSIRRGLRTATSIAYWARNCCEYAVLAVSANGQVRTADPHPDQCFHLRHRSVPLGTRVMFSRSAQANSADLYVIGQFNPTANHN